MRKLVPNSVYEAGIVDYDYQIKRIRNQSVSTVCIIIPHYATLIRFKSHCNREGWNFVDLDGINNFWSDKHNTDVSHRMSGWTSLSSVVVSRSSLILCSDIKDEWKYFVKYGWTIMLCSDNLTSGEIKEFHDRKMLINVLMATLDDIKMFVYVGNANAFGMRNTLIPRLDDDSERALAVNTIIHSAAWLSIKLNKKLFIHKQGPEIRVKVAEMGYPCFTDSTNNLNSVMFSPGNVLVSKGGVENILKQNMLLRGLCTINVSASVIKYIGIGVNGNFMGARVEKYDGKLNEDFVLLINRPTTDYGLPHLGKDSAQYVDMMNSDLMLCHELKKLKTCKRIVFLCPIRPIYSASIIKSNMFKYRHWPYDTLDISKMIFFYNRNIKVYYKKKVYLYGPPGAGKSTVIKALGTEAIDVEDLGDTYDNRLKGMKNNSNYDYFGMADMSDYECIDDYIPIRCVILPSLEEYIKRYSQRNKLLPDKVGQNELFKYKSYSDSQSNYDMVFHDEALDEIINRIKALNLTGDDFISLTDLYYRTLNYNRYKLSGYQSELLDERAFECALDLCSIKTFNEEYLHLNFNSSYDQDVLQKKRGVTFISIHSDHSWHKYWGTGINIHHVSEVIAMGVLPDSSTLNSVTSCDSSNRFITENYCVSNLIIDNLGYNTLHNSQTCYMLASPRIMRKAFGFDSLDIYRLRSFSFHNIDPSKQIIVSKSGLYRDDKGRDVNISGHMLNMIMTSTFLPIDLPRWFVAIENNMLMHLKDQKVNKTLNHLLSINDIVEEDGAKILWHIPSDYINTVDIALDFIEFLKLDEIDFKYIRTWIKYFYDKYDKFFPPNIHDQMLIGAFDEIKK